MKRGSMLLLAAAWPVAGFAQTTSVSRFVASYAATHDFSGTIAIQERGRTTLEASFGLANRAFRVRNTARTKYWIASITKAFTAVLVLMLRDEGKLDLEAPIARYLPEYRGAGAAKITVHQLLNHTSGIANFDQVKSAEDAIRNGLPAYQTPQTSEHLLARVARSEMAHEPGSTFDYNNGDYIVLGKIVEVLSGQSYETALQTRILSPLGMTQSGMMHQALIVPDLAETYFVREDLKALANALPVYPENWYAAGAMYSTTADLMRFSRALFAGRLVTPASLALLMKPGLDDYGYGVWSFESKFGNRTMHVVKRPGQIMGVQTQLYHIVEADISIVILANTGTTDLDEFVAEVAKQVVAATDRRK